MDTSSKQPQRYPLILILDCCFSVLSKLELAANLLNKGVWTKPAVDLVYATVDEISELQNTTGDLVKGELSNFYDLKEIYFQGKYNCTYYFVDLHVFLFQVSMPNAFPKRIVGFW